MSKNVKRVPGAANYYAAIDREEGAPVVVMEPMDGEGVCVVELCDTEAKAVKAADRWQKKENAAVLRARKLAKKIPALVDEIFGPTPKGRA